MEVNFTKIYLNSIHHEIYKMKTEQVRKWQYLEIVAIKLQILLKRNLYGRVIDDHSSFK